MDNNKILPTYVLQKINIVLYFITKRPILSGNISLAVLIITYLLLN